MQEKFKWKAKWTIEKRIEGEKDPYEIVEIDGNLALTAGIQLVWTAVAGGTITAYDNTNAYLGVGDGTTAATASDTALAGTNTAWVAMETSYPTYGSGNTIVFRSVFGSSVGNFDWQELAVGNGSAGGTLLNRKVTDQGTKVSGQSWTLTLTLSLS